MSRAVCPTCGAIATVAEAAGAVAISWAEGARNACEAMKRDPKLTHLSQCPAMASALSSPFLAQG